MKLLPCSKDVCQECAVDHKPEDPHNQQSLYYQYKFFFEHKRWPTWQDAIAHCDPQTQKLWKALLVEGGHWSEPPTEPTHDTRITESPQTNSPGTATGNPSTDPDAEGAITPEAS